jgi:hypothetical protein
MRLTPLTAVVGVAFIAAGSLHAQTAATGSAGCAAITQAAATGAANRVAADGQTIQQPQSVTNLTCLNNFFSGTGLNLVTNLLNPTNLLNAVEGEICNAIKQEWNTLIGSATCGLTITGFNMGFGGLGGGLSCPKLSFGGGGPPLATFGLGAGGASSGSGLYINGSGVPPTGYQLPTTPQGIF